MTTDHAEQIEQQIARAWQQYVTACLDHQPDTAALAMSQIDRLLDRLPRPREAMDDAVVEQPAAGHRD
jgi:hypothetical protein